MEEFQLNGLEISEATKILEKRRVLFEVEEAFENQMNDYSKMMSKFKDQEEVIKGYDNKV